ncbi:putative transmembrane protein [Senna tora]|uniref:Putative transmembrane protein n=1 Tax=Senna tora TaxID=362788 RepID=A0A834TBL0_9FABA|nr:putative transmembrane protein [Senna tora]
MAQNGSHAAHVLVAIMVVGLFCFTKTVAQDSGIAPTPPLEAGHGSVLPLSVVALGSSVLVSLVAFVLQ